jgi:glucose/mannose transport system substrate-binding protein
MSLQVWLNKTVALLRAARPAACCCMALCLVGCDGPQPTKIVLVADSWWKRPSERLAFDDILNQYNAAHSDSVAVNEVTDSNADAARDTLTARLLAGAAPSTFQANIGADVLHWSVVDTTQGTLPSFSRIRSLRDFFDQNRLFDVLPDALTSALVAGSTAEPYTIPVDIHRLNILYYNADSLTAFSARNSGASFLDRDVLCPPDVADRLKDSESKLDVKIAVGTKDNFTLTLLAFESVLPALGGPVLYDDVFRGRASGDWQAQVRVALQCVQYLSRSFLDDHDDTWADALGQVQTGTADFSVMGDWSNGELKTALDSGVVIGVPFPGSEHTYVFTSDTFPLPIGAPYPTQTEELLATIASPDAQLKFSRDKGSIPARSDVDVTELGPRAVSTRSAFYADDVAKVLATSGLFPPYYPGGELNSLLTAMTSPGASNQQIEDVLGLMRDTEPLLARWQRRVAGAPASDP